MTSEVPSKLFYPIILQLSCYCGKIYTDIHFSVLHIKSLTVFSTTHNYFRLKHYSITNCIENNISNIKNKRESDCIFFSFLFIIIPSYSEAMACLSAGS